MTKHEVLIVGSGPTGLMLAGELALAGIEVAVVERRESQALAGARAGGLHSRTIEIFDQRGIADRFLAEGKAAPAAQFAGNSLELSDFPTRHPYVLGLWQNHIERILADWIRELKVPIHYGSAVTAFTQNDAGVSVELANGQSWGTQYLVGCDGGRSFIRKAAGIEFPGVDATTSSLIAEVEMKEEPKWGIHRDDLGVHSFNRLEEGKSTVRVLVTERELSSTGEPTLGDLSAALIAVYGTDFGVHHPTWISRFTDMARQAAAYRERRVLLAGDAAHVHAPDGGQGLQIGVQDAVNLGWKLAQVIKRISPESLLDSYHAERHPIAARVLRNTMAAITLRRLDIRTKALRDIMAELFAMDEPRKRFAGIISGLDIQYPLGEGHPLLGRRMPDLDLMTSRGPLRIYTLLHQARPLLVDFGSLGNFDLTPWLSRVPLIDANYVGKWELPVVGHIAAPAAVLVRPDGYVAWVGEGSAKGLAEALTTWFGPPNEATNPG